MSIATKTGHVDERPYIVGTFRTMYDGLKITRLGDGEYEYNKPTTEYNIVVFKETDENNHTPHFHLINVKLNLNIAFHIFTGSHYIHEDDEESTDECFPNLYEYRQMDNFLNKYIDEEFRYYTYWDEIVKAWIRLNPEDHADNLNENETYEFSKPIYTSHSTLRSYMDSKSSRKRK